MTNHVRNQSVVRRLTNIVRSIPSKLWRHKIVTGIRVCVGAVVFSTMVFAGYYGYTSWTHQQRVVAEADLCRVEAEVLQHNDLSQRWTEAKIADVAELPFVDFGYVRKEVTVQVTLAGDKFQYVSLEGVVGREPELQGTGLTWGKPVGRKSEPAILLPQRFFERLGGRLDAAGSPQPRNASLVVTRVKDGAPQTQRLEMRIAGLLKRDSGKVYGPLDLTIQLDRWQTHKSDSPLGESADLLERLVNYDFVDAYVPPGLADKVAEEEASFGVQAERVGEVDLLCPRGDLWALAVPQNPEKGGGILDDATLPATPGQEVWPVWRFQQEVEGRQMVYAALREDDPRWAAAPRGRAPEFGELLAVEQGRVPRGGALGQCVKWSPLAEPLPDVPRADVYGTDRSLQWLRFEPQDSAAVRKQTRIDIGGYDAAAALHRVRPAQVHADQPTAWSMVEIEIPAGSPRENENRPAGRESLPDQARPAEVEVQTATLSEIVESLRRQSPGWECGIVRRGVVRVEPVAARTSGDRGTGSSAAIGRLTRVRFVPVRFFDGLTDSSAWQHFGSEGLPCVVLSDGKNEIDFGKVRMGDHPLRPLATIAGSQSEVWFPDAFSAAVPAEATAVGFVIWGAWHQMAALNTAVEQLPATVAARRFLDKAPRQYWIIQDSAGGDWEALLKETQLDRDRVAVSPKHPGADATGLAKDTQVDRGRVQVSQLFSLPVRLQLDGRILAERIVAVPGQPNATPGSRVAGLRQCPAGAATVPIVVGGRREELVLRKNPNALPGDVCVSMDLFRRLAFEADAASKSLPGLGRSVSTFRFADAHAFRQMQRRLSEHGIRLELIEDVPQARLLKYAVRAEGPQGGSAPVTPAKAAELVMARPTFQAVFPRLRVTALLDGKPLEIGSAGGGEDPRWFEFPLLAGRPIEGGAKQGEVCLPMKVAEHQFPGLSPDDIVGRTVRLTLNRTDGVPRLEAGVPLLLKVVAVGGSEQGLASLENVTAWRLWQEGKLVHDNSTGQFRSPAEVYEQRGFISAVFYALSDGAVRRLVEHLESLGCDVEHRLDDQEGLGRLAIALTTLVILFVSGSILNASANSGAVSWMDLTTKFKEIGIKMAYGVTRGDIVFAYIVEGFIVGVLACTAGSILVGAGDPLLRDLIARTIGLGPDYFVFPVFGLAVAWLYGVAGAIVVGFNVLGTLLPTWLALRKSPVELLR